MKFPLDKSRTCVIIQRLFDSIIEFGGIAQLGERLNGIQEVSGSIPLISTRSALKTVGFQGFFLFCGTLVAGGATCMTESCRNWLRRQLHPFAFLLSIVSSKIVSHMATYVKSFLRSSLHLASNH